MAIRRHCERSAAIQTVWRLPLDCRVAALLAMTLAGCTGQPAIPSGGIVSNNPCIDGILAEIAATGQIAAISAYSHAPASSSASLSWARKLPALGTTAEEIIAAKPRLVLTGNLASQGTNAALAKAGLTMVAMGVPASVAESIDHVRQVARAIGRVKAGEELITRIDAPLSPKERKGQSSAIIWQSGGFVPGKGSLQDELLTRAGFQNASARYGLGQWSQLPLEVLMRNPPDVIFTSKPHPAFARLPHTRIVPLPDRLSFCGGPTIIEAMKVLQS
jgi:iron complex transport system substrate-binding protein